MVFKPTSVRERLKLLEEALSRLSRYRGRPRETFIADVELQWIVERGFILVAECVVDIATHILSGKFKIQPSDHEDAVQRLGQERVISEALASKLRGFGGFRNVLVHGYVRIDPVRVHEHLETGLEPLHSFVAEVTRWLQAAKE